MEPQEPQDLAERVTRLEAQVAWLLQQPAPPRPAVAPQRLPRPIPKPAAPGREISPVVWIAGIAASIFLIGAIFFFHWAVQQGWVGPELRFVLGLLVGGGIAAFAARLMLRGTPRLGVALLLAGLGTLQFTFRAGAMTYHFFPAALGLVATAFLTLVAGALAARVKSGAALTVALVSGLVAPLVFSQGGHHELALTLYLAVLLAAALAVPYLARSGEAWHGARWTALLGVWLWLLGACVEVPRADTAALGGLLLLHLLLAGLWTWLPRAEEKPGTPTALWLVVSVLTTTYGWLLWKRTDLSVETFALPVLALAALNLVLVKPLRERLGDRRADWGLLALAAGHLSLAVPVALAWRGVGPVWGLFALSLAWASGRARAAEHAEEATSLRWLGAALALLTSLRWAFHHLDGLFGSSYSGTLPFFNSAFAEGALVSLAWFLLLQGGGPLRVISFLALELTANLTLALEAAHLVRRLQTPANFSYGYSRGASVAITLVLALSGAWQWMRSLNLRDETRKAWMIAGYVWMGLASFKLIAVDLDGADTPLRALAFLGVGGIGMAAAILANRHRGQESS